MFKVVAVMWDMFSNTCRLFLKGKLFRDPRAVFMRWLIVFAVVAAVVLVLGLAGLPIWLVVLLSALAGGALQPFLFKDLKYQ
ncbi:MAG: hypothetical protein KF778_06475 [Rhodocyclaceae bacterium]|nr:hypothetical protein [Rhodocyclaceae bacterium]MBX3668031.1 hypothetical protein [Rhodocyclaceae bacterium]